jgi:hypothetical protein
MVKRRLTAPARWWRALEANERILWRCILLLAIGGGLIWPPLAFLLPGVVFGLVFFEFSFRRGA